VPDTLVAAQNSSVLHENTLNGPNSAAKAYTGEKVERYCTRIHFKKKSGLIWPVKHQMVTLTERVSSGVPCKRQLVAARKNLSNVTRLLTSATEPPMLHTSAKRKSASVWRRAVASGRAA
jgi:hypothetical protein